jgi:hypothetical protein
LVNSINLLTNEKSGNFPRGIERTYYLAQSKGTYRSRRRGTTPRLDAGRNDRVKKKVRWLLQNGFTFTGKKTIRGRDYLYARKGRVFRSAGPYSIAEPYRRSLITREEPEPAARRGADEIAEAAKREFDQLEEDAISDPSRLSDYIRELVPRRNPDLWRRFFLLAGSEGPNVVDAESVNFSYRERVRTAVASGDRVPVYYEHVVGKMNKWVKGAIESKRGHLAPLGTASMSCSACHSKLEAYPDAKTKFQTYKVWCKSCRGYRTWECSICGEVVRCIRDDKQALCLRCPRCEYGYTFAEPIKLNSPRTDGGWKLLDNIKFWSPRTFESDPDVVINVVRNYESEPKFYDENPRSLSLHLRNMDIPATKADAIASLQLHKFVRTTDALGGF